MVKNTCGGNRHKKQASKAIQEAKQPTKLRKAAEDGEVYAVVTKMVGGALCNVIGVDNVPRSCVIRGKFRGGGGKRNNFIKMGTLVLIGDREWMGTVGGGGCGGVGTTKEKEKYVVCDLLEVYTDLEKDQLISQCPTVNWTVLNDVDNAGTKVDDSVLFTETAGQDNDFYAALAARKVGGGGGGGGIGGIVGVGDCDEGQIDIDAI